MIIIPKTTSKKYTKPNNCTNIAPGEYNPDNIVMVPMVINITKNIINVLLKSFNPNIPSLGLPKKIETITPSKTEYTIYLSSGGAVGNTTFDFTRGMDFLVQPRLNSLQNGTTYNFNFTLNSSYWSVTKYGFTMFNGSGQVLGYNESTSFSSPPTLNLFTGENASIRMEYFWLVTGNYTNGTR